MKSIIASIANVFKKRKITDVTQKQNTDSQRCLNILNYWLDSELFDLPECPMDPSKDIISKAADSFLQQWGEEANQRYLMGKLAFNEDSRLLVMFQCHLAGYLLEPEEAQPNYRTPRTFLVAQAMIPSWDETAQTIRWTRSDDEQDLTINMATIRTLYRKCNSSVPKNMSLSEWIDARLDTIDTRLTTTLTPLDDAPAFTSEQLAEKIRLINRDLANEFWPDRASREYMVERCKPLDSQLADTDKPYQSQNGFVTFRWRHCFFQDNNTIQQLGPFFVQDLEHMIQCVEKNGVEQGLSTPLQRYLLGALKQQELGTAAEHGEQYLPLTNHLLQGRWPENKQYGLTLLQTVAVNVATDQKHNPVVAVNGPPGTGKTTLLKDIIADHYVKRTQTLLALAQEKKEDWFDSNAYQAILAHSMIVASSNNKAVENISKELPSLGKIDSEYQPQTACFKSVAPQGDWGLFCAVLGNSTNRKNFKGQINKLNKHLKSRHDHYQISHFYYSLKKASLDERQAIIARFITQWHQDNVLNAVITEIEQSSAYKQADKFFKPLCLSLTKIADDELDIVTLAQNWSQYDDDNWQYALDGLDRLKRQWWARKLAQQQLDHKLTQATLDLKQADENWQQISIDIHKNHNKTKWGLDSPRYLSNKNDYLCQANEQLTDAEKRIQQASPFGSAEINHVRSELFIKSLAYTEALIEANSSAFTEQDWKDLNALIDGKLTSNEKEPYHARLWSLLFLFFPVLSSSLASAENQFRLMQKANGFGLVMFDESGQAVNYHVAGLLQRCRQAIFVGDPIQLEPVVTMPANIDRALAEDFIPLSQHAEETRWGDNYLISQSSAQSVADLAGNFMAKIGDRQVGIPLLVHRRCCEPMFTIANKIAYDNKMVLASQPFKWHAIQSGWINIAETAPIHSQGYFNTQEAESALAVTRFLCETQPEMVKGGVYIITPFSKMRATLMKAWKTQAADPNHHHWMRAAFGDKPSHDLNLFATENIGTVHTFQGKEASTVLICTAASQIRKNTGGITWVNSKPNLLNVAVTRAKHHLFVLGDQKDWQHGAMSSELQSDGMTCYADLNAFYQAVATPLEAHQKTVKSSKEYNDESFALY